MLEEIDGSIADENIVYVDRAALAAHNAEMARLRERLDRLAKKGADALGEEWKEQYRRMEGRLKGYANRADELRWFMQNAGLPVESETSEYVIRDAQAALAALIDNTKQEKVT